MTETYILIGILKEKDYWFTGFKNESQCKAYAIISKFEWWDCVLTLF
tara:strand:+ start:1109 stop:1249 length:141 start_codon:yes stop_codon:yes gene_type:complete